jgi:cell division septation protein DedD
MPQNDDFDKNTPMKALVPNWKTIAGFVAFVLIIGFIWYSYSGSGENKSAQIPIIYAQKSDYKIAPDNRGGMQTQNNDSTIYNVLRGTDDLEGVDLNENLIEEPAFEGGEGVIFKETNASTDEPNVENLFDAVSEKPDLPLDTKQVTEVVTPEEPVVEEKAEAVETKTEPKTEETDMKEVLESLQKPQAKPAVTAVEKPVAQPVVKTTAPLSAGTHYIQMASFRDRASAQQGYQNIMKKYGSDLTGLSVRYSPVMVEGKGEFVRVQMGALSKEQASSLCTKLKEKGANCYVVTN